MTTAQEALRAAEAPEPPWRRLSTRMLLVHPVQELIRAIPALAGLLVAGGSSGNGAQWALIGVAVVILLGLVRWFTTRWRITPEQVQLKGGIVNRRLRTVARDRVRTVDVTASPMHRVLGLARVAIGTGRSDRGADAGLRLDGLRREDAQRLREVLLHRAPAPGPAWAQSPERAGAAPDAAAAEVEIARLDPAWVRYGPFTLSGVVAVGVIGGFAANVLSEAGVDPSDVGPLRSAADAVEGLPVVVAVVGGVVVALLIVTLLSTVGYVLAYWGYRLSRHEGGTLHVARGLLTTRATSIEERRLRGAEIVDPLLLRAAGGARLLALATGLGASRDRGGSLLVPPAPGAEARRVAAVVLRDEAPLAAPLRGHGPAAGRRRATRALGPALAVVALSVAARVALDAPDWLWQAALAGLPVAALLAADRARNLGHATVAGHLVAREGSLVRRRRALESEGVIGVNLSRSWFQRRAGLLTLTATTAAGDQAVRVLDVDDRRGAARRAGDRAGPARAVPGGVTASPKGDCPARPGGPMLGPQRPGGPHAHHASPASRRPHRRARSRRPARPRPGDALRGTVRRVAAVPGRPDLPGPAGHHALQPQRRDARPRRPHPADALRVRRRVLAPGQLPLARRVLDRELQRALRVPAPDARAGRHDEDDVRGVRPGTRRRRPDARVGDLADAHRRPRRGHRRGDQHVHVDHRPLPGPPVSPRRLEGGPRRPVEGAMAQRRSRPRGR